MQRRCSSQGPRPWMWLILSWILAYDVVIGRYLPLPRCCIPGFVRLRIPDPWRSDAQIETLPRRIIKSLKLSVTVGNFISRDSFWFLVFNEGLIDEEGDVLECGYELVYVHEVARERGISMWMGNVRSVTVNLWSVRKLGGNQCSVI